MILCCAQIRSVWEDPDATLAKAEHCIARASREGGDLVCFPEQFATGWDPSSLRHVQDMSGPIVARLQALAEEYSIAVLGSLRKNARPRPENTCVAISARGEILAEYSKCHLFSPAGEDRYYQRGKSIATFPLGGMTFGIAICYDLRFASLFSLYSDAGVDGILVPAAWPASRLSHWELFVRARALEYQVYVAGINTTGATPVDVYKGGTIVADPTGAPVISAGAEEGVYSCELRREFVERVRAALPVGRDRRSDLPPAGGSRG
ncbi:MAG: nitrilase-related carbon-nitrogen hydrolase [Methanolinea sp.]|nr:nitrilase-related carbon-nitrogen hydrolase [Methanolinea sp.]